MIKYTNQLNNDDLLVQAQGLGNYFAENENEEICDIAKSARKLSLLARKIKLQPESKSLQIKALKTAPTTIFAIDEETNELLGFCTCYYQQVDDRGIPYYPNIFVKDCENKIEILMSLIHSSADLYWNLDYVSTSVMSVNKDMRFGNTDKIIYEVSEQQLEEKDSLKEYDIMMKNLVNRVPDTFGNVPYQEDENGNIIIPMLDFDYWPDPYYSSKSTITR